jgi:hypothetical protein
MSKLDPRINWSWWPYDEGPLDPREVWGIPAEFWQLVLDYAIGNGCTLNAACQRIAPAIPPRPLTVE